MPSESCPHPQDRLRPLLDARDPVTAERFAVAECGACGLAVTLPRPADLSRHYPAAYHRAPGARRFPLPVEAVQAALYAWRARAVERLAGTPGRVLDVGCGPGALLRAFRARGWDGRGTELTDVAAAAARAAGFPVHVGPLDAAPWASGSFDAVVLWHALEHWPDPREPLAAAARLLRPGGVLLAGVPNFGSPEARLAGAGWFHLDVPRHLCHLTPESLGAALAATGFEARSTSFLAPEYDVFSFVQSAENALGLPQNLLYDLLRARRSRLGAASSSLAQGLALALAAPLGLAAVPATLALGLAGRGSSLSVLATRAP